MRTAVIAAVVLASCYARAGEPNALDWSMRLENGALVVEFSIVNQHDKAIYVAELPTDSGGRRASNKLIVAMEKDIRYPSAPNRIVLLRDDWAPIVTDQDVFFPAIWKRIAPHATYHAKAIVPLPLDAWAPTGHKPQLDRSQRNVVLLIGYLVGSPKHSARRPSPGDTDYLEGRPQRLPDDVTFAPADR